MFLRRAAPALARRTVAARPVAFRSFAVSARQCKEDPKVGQSSPSLVPFEQVTGPHDLMPPGGRPGEVPSDLDQATGLERLEILGKMQGVDIFDMKPLDASRKGTLEDPIMVNSFGNEQYVGCTGCPADSHVVLWLTISRDRPIERCPECGSVYKMEYIGPQDDGHHDDHHDHHHDQKSYFIHPYEGEPKTLADYVKPEYR